LQADGLSPWTVKRILGALSCVFTLALRRGYVATHPFQRLERVNAARNNPDGRKSTSGVRLYLWGDRSTSGIIGTTARPLRRQTGRRRYSLGECSS
jgi:hypothetical protein